MDISVIILSFNTKDITVRCLEELESVCSKSAPLSFQVIVVDNGSHDGSIAMLQEFKPSAFTLETIFNKENVGFSKGNNQGLSKAKGKYVLFLNSDVMVAHTERPIDFGDVTKYMETHKDMGALTVKVELPGGGIDPASHRGFPTPWRSLTYFLKAESILKKFNVSNPTLRKMFGGYHLMHEDIDSTHRIDAGTAAFLLCKCEVLSELGGFDEQFFMYGEDLDLCYRMKEKGHQLTWYPKYSVTHLKYQSGLKSQDAQTKKQIRWHFYDAMEKFYQKHYENKYCPCINILTHAIIRLMKIKSNGVGN